MVLSLSVYMFTATTIGLWAPWAEGQCLTHFVSPSSNIIAGCSGCSRNVCVEDIGWITSDLHACMEDSRPQSSSDNTQLSALPTVPEDGQGEKPPLVTVRSRLCGGKSLSRLPWKWKKKPPLVLSCSCCPPRDSAFVLSLVLRKYTWKGL